MAGKTSKGRRPTSAEIVLNEAESMSVFCRDHPLAPVRGRLTQAGTVPLGDLRRIRSGTRVRIAGLVIILHTPPTKSGKRVMFVTLEDETGLADLVVFPAAQKQYAKTILTAEVLTLDGTLQRQGERGISISVVMERAVTYLSGSLSSLLMKAETGTDTGPTQLSVWPCFS